MNSVESDVPIFASAAAPEQSAPVSKVESEQPAKHSEKRSYSRRTSASEVASKLNDLISVADATVERLNLLSSTPLLEERYKRYTIVGYSGLGLAFISFAACVVLTVFVTINSNMLTVVDQRLRLLEEYHIATTQLSDHPVNGVMYHCLRGAYGAFGETTKSGDATVLEAANVANNQINLRILGGIAKSPVGPASATAIPK